MNIQALMKQAQKMQQDLSKKQGELNEKIFPGKYSLVEIEMMGNKELKKIKLTQDFGLDKEDAEILEDAILLAINNTMKEIDKETEKIMGSIPKVPGVF